MRGPWEHGSRVTTHESRITGGSPFINYKKLPRAFAAGENSKIPFSPPGAALIAWRCSLGSWFSLTPAVTFKPSPTTWPSRSAAGAHGRGAPNGVGYPQRRQQLPGPSKTKTDPSSLLLHVAFSAPATQSNKSRAPR